MISSDQSGNDDQGVTKFCNLDRWVSCRNLLFFYDGVLDPRSLEISLKKALKKVPILSSVIRSVGEDATKRYYFKHVMPNNISFTRKMVDDKLFDFFKFQKEGFINEKCYEEGFELCRRIEKVEVGANPRRDVVEDVPMMKVTLMQTKTSQKTILGIAINHATSDLYGFVMFMNCWMRGEKSEMPTFDISRSQIFDPTDENFDLNKYEDKEMIKKYSSSLPVAPEGYTEELFSEADEKGIHKIINFTRNRCEELKKLVKVEEGIKYSSFDCIAAHMYKVHALRTNVSDDTIMPLMILVNMRFRHKSIAYNYFGNCILIPALEMTRTEIINISFTDLVMSIRKLIESVDEKDLEFFMNMWKVKLPKLRPYTFNINDWRIMDRVNYDFLPDDEGLQAIKCERCEIYPPNSPKMTMNYKFTSLRQMKNNEGIYAKLCLQSSFLEKVGWETDLSSPEVLKNLIENAR